MTANIYFANDNAVVTVENLKSVSVFKGYSLDGKYTSDKNNFSDLFIVENRSYSFTGETTVVIPGNKILYVEFV